MSEKSEENVVPPELQRARVKYDQKLAHLQYEIERLVCAALTGEDHHSDVTAETIDVRMERLELFTEIIRITRELILSKANMDIPKIDGLLILLERNIQKFRQSHFGDIST